MALLIILGIIALVILFYVLMHYKTLKLGSLVLVTGGVKTGKSTLSVHLAIKEIKRRQREVKVRNFFNRLFARELLEKPLLYSNVPLAVPYVPLTNDILQRKARVAYGSVVYVQEASLVADAESYKDAVANERLMLFCKLWGHMSHGGIAIFDTQAICDLNKNIRKCVSNYFYIHHLNKWFLLPFITLYVKEEVYSEDKTRINVNEKDYEDELKKVLVSSKTWMKFDRYCYSKFTDHLDYDKKEVHALSLKADRVNGFTDKKWESLQ